MKSTHGFGIATINMDRNEIALACLRGLLSNDRYAKQMPDKMAMRGLMDLAFSLADSFLEKARVK